MERSENTGAGPWGVITGALGALVLAIAAVGVVGVVVNERVRDVTERALGYDVEVEDEGDDLRAAVLDLRHYHRNITFGGPSATALGDHQTAYDALLEEIDELAQLDVSGLDVTQPAELRELAAAYYDGFRPVTADPAADPQALSLASEVGLRRIEELEQAAEELDALGERLAEASLARLDESTNTARIVLLALLGGVALIGVILAVTARRILERIRTAYDREQAASRELAHALRAKNDFIADASHELRTPLTVIRGNADIGLATPGEPIHRDVLRDIAAEAARMSRLVEDLLFLARSDAGVAPLEREYVPARWLLSRIVKPAEVLAQQRGSCLTVTVGGSGDLEADPARIEQAVLILVDNAAKHSPPGTCVTLAARTANGEFVIDVADSGPGIPPEELPLIFDRFYQVGRRRTRKKGGAGLGLSIAKTIVEGHGGRIDVHSHLDRGTRMTIRVPLATEPVPTAVPTADERLVPA